MTGTTALNSVDVVTLGCRLNTYEAEVMRAKAAEAGLHDAVIVNTCAVTGEAVRQARQTIRRLRRERPGARIIVTGCAAQTEPETFAAMDEVDQVLGNAEKLEARSYRPLDLALQEQKLRVSDIMDVRETAGHLIAGMDGRARAFVQVQNGCDHRCTFCIIPFGRGPSRSVPVGTIVEQIRHLDANGCREIVLTGVDLTAYGADLPGTPSLGQLVERILRLVPGLARLRLSSIDVAECDERLMALLAHEPRLMPHVHLSLQAGDDMILKRMKRRHTRKQAIEFCANLRGARPEIVFGADLIAGFPTETDGMFENSRALIAECGLTWLHVFPFSARKGTPASRMPAVAGAAIKERARLLRDEGAAAVARHLDDLVGRTEKVLVEAPLSARTRTYAPMRLAAAAEPGTLISVRIESHDGRVASGAQAAE